MTPPTLNGICRHAICAVAFGIRWAVILVAIALWLVCVAVGGVAGYVWVTTYGWLPMLITMALIAGGFVLLIAIAIGAMALIDWAESNNCRI